VGYDEDEDNHHQVARPFFEVSLGGQGYPEEYDSGILIAEFLRNPVLAELRRTLEERVGPLTPYFSFSC
ncbi:MAG: hypothetical protein KDA21_12560, partial [Phycisphaerales bacterium]|nr:hypothetical protein [Phycisphaerales bacterium]